MLAAASAAAIYLLNTPQKTGKEKKIGLVSKSQNETKTKVFPKKKKNQKKETDTEIINQMMKELKKKREEILRKFDESKNRSVPKEMIETMSYINSRDPKKHPPSIRLLCSQLIQDYIVMYTNVERCEPDSQIIDFGKNWLDFQSIDTQILIEQISQKYSLAQRRSFF
ncbi:hypothetical protein RFI_16127 [Reticulomyxa filosa]|uniref:Uncharacterized protein n=1 Tax=Reticulomyxa filosa TaxID=46433 RepID=X6N5P9_RETFI|nr:hypothetical protein RFI_16127 [Reticulomyxa filosa]|eukprot:ETO21074.1 hypothetical protein RFI_16127 [Reticulomyxa filosa]